MTGPRGPSLRRRLALILSAVAAGDFLVIAAIWNTIGNMWIPHSYTAYCHGRLPFLPTPVPSCGYGGGARVVSVLPVLLVVALLLWSNWLVAGWALRPLRVTAETVRRLGPQNLGQRIELRTGPDALKELADALDDALDRLAAGYESQRRFASNASQGPGPVHRPFHRRRARGHGPRPAAAGWRPDRRNRIPGLIRIRGGSGGPAADQPDGRGDEQR